MRVTGIRHPVRPEVVPVPVARLPLSGHGQLIKPLAWHVQHSALYETCAFIY